VQQSRAYLRRPCERRTTLLITHDGAEAEQLWARVVELMRPPTA